MIVSMTPENLRNQLLAQRGYDTLETKEVFLFPKYDQMYNPFLMHDMQKAVLRIFAAIENNELICIYSDYDADGIPGAVILHDFFKKIGYEHFWNYIPHRHTEGYGLHRDALEKIKARGTQLVITVDLGITAVSEVVFARELGLEIIITDHHEPLEMIPDAYAIVNPKLGNYPDRMLCGAGVAFKLVQAMISGNKIPSEGYSDGIRDLLKKIPEGWEKWLLDMAGLATLSDMVPLVNENRIIAYYGMKVLQKTQRPGLQALFQKSGISLHHLIEDDIVFSITPRLNAASRMAHPEDAFKTLATSDPVIAVSAAEYLSSLNDERKKIVAQIMKEVHKKVVARRVSGSLRNVLVIGDPTWPAGILGLIAGKIVEEYSITTFVWGSESESEEESVTLGISSVLKGSCRGIGDISVVALMQTNESLLVQFGGHEEAGGFTVTRETVHLLEDAFCDSYVSIKHQVSKQVVTITADAELDVNDVTFAHYTALRTLAPFGVGNPKPIFTFQNVSIISMKQFGKTKEHLEIVIVSGSKKCRAISWYAHAETFSRKLVVGESIRLLAEMEFSVFRGVSELRLKIVDVL